MVTRYRRYLTLALPGALLCLIGCVSKTSARSFTLVDYQRYRTEVIPLTARSGRELVQQFCFTPPPGCEPKSIACSIHPEYPGANWQYHYEVNRVSNTKRAGQRLYYVKSVELDPQTAQGYVFRADKPGRILVWKNIVRNPAQRALVFQYLRESSGDREAKVRIAYLDRLAREVAWHERQHVREGIVFNRELERIMNSPAGYPRLLAVKVNEKPARVLAKAIDQDRGQRIEDLLTRNAACSEKFHAHEARADSYATLLGQCACYGGEACRVTLPTPPQRDFVCDLPLPANRALVTTAKN